MESFDFISLIVIFSVKRKKIENIFADKYVANLKDIS